MSESFKSECKTEKEDPVRRDCHKQLQEQVEGWEPFCLHVESPPMIKLETNARENQIVHGSRDHERKGDAPQLWDDSKTTMEHADNEFAIDFEATLEDASHVKTEKFKTESGVLYSNSTESPSDNRQQQHQLKHSSYSSCTTRHAKLDAELHLQRQTTNQSVITTQAETIRGKVSVSARGLRLNGKIFSIRKVFRCDTGGIKFLRKSQAPEKMLLSSHRKPYVACDICSEVFDSKSQLTKHLATHVDGQSFKCNMCDQQFSREVELTNHGMIHNKNVGSYSCDFCGINFNLKNLLRKHIGMVHEACDQRKHSGVHTGKKPYTCKVCGKNLSSRRSLESHVQTHGTRKLFLCEICGKSLKTEFSLKIHIDLHMGEKRFSCKVCGDSFARKGALYRHAKLHTRSLACKICGKCFTTTFSLKNHLRNHTGERPFACEICGKSFGNERVRDHHLKTHEKGVDCKICYRSFRSEQAFARHKKKCRRGNRVPCDECNKTYSSRVTLWRHKLTHKGEKRLKCDHCDGGFYTMKDLRTHMRKHTGESITFSCRICGKNFRHEKSLSRHRKTHEEKLHFTCDVCQKNFGMKKALEFHIRTHQEEDQEIRGKRRTPAQQEQKLSIEDAIAALNKFAQE